MGRLVIVLVVLVVLGFATSARADGDACIAAYEQAQQLRKSGKLVDAEQRARECADTQCPAILRRDCVPWLDEIRASTPSLVVTVVGKDGCDLTAARVSV